MVSFRSKERTLAASLIEWGRNFVHDALDDYRPERYYMRGPGPKWHAKHAQRALPDSSCARRPAPADASLLRSPARHGIRRA